MKINYFEDVDVMSFYFGKKKEVDNSRELKNVNLLIDFNKEGNIIGIEIMDFMSALEESQKEIDEIFKLADKKKKPKDKE